MVPRNGDLNTSGRPRVKPPEPVYAATALTVVLKALRSSAGQPDAQYWAQVKDATGLVPFVLARFDVTQHQAAQISTRLQSMNLVSRKGHGRGLVLFVRCDGVTSVTPEMIASGDPVPVVPLPTPGDVLDSADDTGGGNALVGTDDGAGLNVSDVAQEESAKSDSIVESTGAIADGGADSTTGPDALCMVLPEHPPIVSSEDGESFALPVRPLTRAQQRERLREVLAHLVAKVGRLEKELDSANRRAVDAEAALATQRAVADQPDPVIDLLIAEYSPGGTQQE